MKLIISNDAAELGIVGPAAIAMHGVRVFDPTPDEIVKCGRRVVADMGNDLDAIFRRAEVAGFRRLFSEMGYSDAEPAGERLVRTFVERGFKSINSLVDAYNISSMRGVCGLGMHDIDGRSEDICVFRALGGEEIVPMFKTKSVKTKQGDLLYAMDQKVMAWLGRKDVDSDAFKVTAKTTSVVLIALGNRATSASHNLEILEGAVRVIRSFSPSVEAQRLGVVF